MPELARSRVFVHVCSCIVPSSTTNLMLMLVILQMRNIWDLVIPRAESRWVMRDPKGGKVQRNKKVVKVDFWEKGKRLIIVKVFLQTEIRAHMMSDILHRIREMHHYTNILIRCT